MYRYIYISSVEWKQSRREKKKKNPLDPLRCVAVRKGRSTHTHAVSKSYFSKEEKRLDIFILLLIHTRVYFPLCTYYTLALSSRDNLLGAQTIRKKKEKKKRNARVSKFLCERFTYFTYLYIDARLAPPFVPSPTKIRKLLFMKELLEKGFWRRE